MALPPGKGSLNLISAFVLVCLFQISVASSDFEDELEGYPDSLSGSSAVASRGGWSPNNPPPWMRRRKCPGLKDLWLRESSTCPSPPKSTSKNTAAESKKDDEPTLDSPLPSVPSVQPKRLIRRPFGIPRLRTCPGFTSRRFFCPKPPRHYWCKKPQVTNTSSVSMFVADVFTAEWCVFTAGCPYGSQINIRNATWGLQEKQVNVTRVLSTYCNDSSFCRFDVDIGHPLDSDPVVGSFGKELNVSYSCEAKEKDRASVYKIVVQERTNMSDVRCPGNEKAELLNATYGYGDKFADVTQKLRDKCANGTCNFEVSNEVLVDKDPNFGQAKVLTAEYRCPNGETANKALTLLLSQTGGSNKLPNLTIIGNLIMYVKN